MKSKSIVQTSDRQFSKDVLESDLPVVVDFYALWCGPCRMVEPILSDLADEYQGKLRFVSVDTDQNQELTEKYGIMSIPTVIFVYRGKLIEKVVGAAPAQIYKKKIAALLNGTGDNPGGSPN
jgi:thioredoxin 1